MSLPSIIAIDGPVASGKTSIGKRLADKLGYLFFDTGVMYRAVTYLALRQLGAVDDVAAVTEVAEQSQIDVQTATVADGRDHTVIAGREREDITWAIRSPEVEDQVSPVSAMPGVRQCLTEQMRRIGCQGRVVMVGRDIGTVVLPEADLKVFLTASVEARARRRYEEIQARGETRDYESILANLRERDQIDSSRPVAPLVAAADAVTLDTTELDVPGVVKAIESLLEARGHGQAGPEASFWLMLDQLVATNEIVVDRPRGSAHPRYPDFVYPADYGYLANTQAMDGGGLDVWVGSMLGRALTGVICTVDLQKRDVELKLLLGCTPAEQRAILATHNAGSQAGILVERPPQPAAAHGEGQTTDE